MPQVISPSAKLHKNRQFDLIAFDWDGTLFDSTRAIVRCIQACVQDLGGTVPSYEAAAHVIGLEISQALACAAPDIAVERYPELGQRYRYHYAQLQNQIHFFDGVFPLLAELKANGHILAVATGKSRRGLNEMLIKPELKGVFDASRTADETAGKPDPCMLYSLMEEFDVPAERTLMIGDTTHDLGMAKNAGWASVAVSYGAHSAENFEAFSPLYVADSVAMLHAWLKTHG